MAKKTKMWIYYYCMHGPGHQGIDADFILFPDDATTEDIEEHISHRLENYYDCILRFWKVEKPSATFLRNRINDIKERIENLEKTLEELKTEECFIRVIVPRQDKEIQEALKSKVIYTVLQELHKQGIMYTEKDVSDLTWGKISPLEPDRTKMLNAIKKAKSYKNKS